MLACTDWPRWEHLPVDTGAGRDPGAAAPAFPWAEAQAAGEPDDDPAALKAEPLAVGEGRLSRSSLLGTGWTSEAPERTECDGAESRFPLYDVGDYAGDVDWWLLEVAEGILCSRFLAADAGVRADVMLYRLDACGSPSEGPALDERGNVGGYATETAENSWALPVEAGIVALVAAGYAPTSTAEQRYRWGLALLGAGEADCPELE